ncbi:unnamed protein product [Rotaria sp. Silwood1]|nr:unnamed protein product [Rotaria sp. Silwood1]
MVGARENPTLPIDRAHRVVFWGCLAQWWQLWRRILAGFTIDMLKFAWKRTSILGFFWRMVGAKENPKLPVVRARRVDILALFGAGVAGGSYLNSAELYDPSTGTWTNTGSMSTAREYHTASVLTNGKVLVAGGLSSSYWNSAESYDPSTGTWTNTSSMSTARFYHTASVLTNGKVLVAGGSSGSYLKSAELYDPLTGTWTNTSSMSTARYRHTASILTNGKVLVTAGYSGSYLNSAELYQP